MYAANRTSRPSTSDLCVEAGLLVKEVADIRSCWVPREMNLEADTLASRAPRPRPLTPTNAIPLGHSRPAPRSDNTSAKLGVVEEIEGRRGFRQAQFIPMAQQL